MAEMRIEHLVAGMIQTNVYLVMNSDTKELIIIDPADDAEGIAAKISEMEGSPVAIFLTHGHFDHRLAANALKEKYNIPVVACGLEKEVLALPSMWGMQADDLDIDTEVSDNESIRYAGFDIKVLHTPGHTVGSVCYYFPEEGVLFSGDTLFRMSYGRTDFPTGSPQDMFKSVQRLLTELPPETKVYPGHEGFTQIEIEQRYNPLA